MTAQASLLNAFVPVGLPAPSEPVMYQAVVDALPYAVFWKDLNLRFYGCNARFAASAGMPAPGALIGRDDFDMPWLTAQTEAFRADDLQVIRSGVAKLGIIETLRGADGEDRWVETHKAPLRDPKGAVIGVLGWYHDITERRRAEEAAARAQQQALDELATPLLPVADGVVVMPLIGSIDRARAIQVIHTLLAGVAEHRARVAILDVTGVRGFDTSVLDTLGRAARGIRLLGAEAVITGVGPVVAQAIVTLGVDLRDVVALADLKSGISFALALRRRSVTGRPAGSP